jgi:PAS domain S-box-containing protein
MIPVPPSESANIIETCVLESLDSLLEAFALLEPIRNSENEVVDFRVEYANQVALDYYCTTRERHIGRLVSEIYPIGRSSGLFDLQVKVLATGAPIFLKAVHMENPNGVFASGICVDLRFSRIHGRVAMAWKDVSDLQRVNDRLVLAKQVARMGTFEVNLATNKVFWSPDLEKLYGLKPGEFEGDIEGWERRVDPLDLALAREHVRLTLVNGYNDAEFRIMWPDGSIRWLSARTKLIKNELGAALRILGVCFDITERKSKETELLRLNRVLKALSDSSRAMMRVEDETSYLNEICRIAVEDCGYDMVWIGFAENDEAKSIRPVASAGFDNAYLESLRLTWADSELGRGPTGTAIRTGRASQCKNMRTDPSFTPWREEALKNGYSSSLVHPLLNNGTAFGSISFYSKLINPFSDDEIALLSELASDLAIGLSVLRLRRSRELAEEQLLQAKVAAEAANLAKSAFLANMSHEIRTPLGAIMGFSDLVIDPEVDSSEKKNYVAAIQRNGELLANIVNDILDLSKVEAGKLEVQSQEVLLSEVLQDTHTLLNLQAKAKGIDLIITVDDNVSDFLNTDQLRLRQVLLNVIGNAIKFTIMGSVQVSVFEQISVGGRNLLHFAVKDTGRGIPSDQIGKLFSPFFQADDSSKRKYGGTGLGLVLSKRLSNLLGGDTVLTQSELGSGSTFTISIDPGLNSSSSSASTFSSSSTSSSASFSANKLDKTQIQVRSHSNQNKTIQSKAKSSKFDEARVLLTDDSPDNQLLVSRILRLAGANVSVAANGKEGLEMALNGNYSVVLMDLQMPIMDGYEATASLRRSGYKGHIVALTAHALDGERQRCIECGFDDYLSKPINRGALLELVNRYSSVARKTNYLNDGYTNTL